MRYSIYIALALIVSVTACTMQDADLAETKLAKAEQLDAFDSIGFIHNYGFIDLIGKMPEPEDVKGFMQLTSLDDEAQYVFDRLRNIGLHSTNVRADLIALSPDFEPMADILEEFQAGNYNPSSWKAKVAHYTGAKKRVAAVFLYSLCLHSGINYKEQWGIRHTIANGAIELDADTLTKKQIQAIALADGAGAVWGIPTGIGALWAAIGWSGRALVITVVTNDGGDVLNWYIPPSYQGDNDWSPTYEIDYPEIVW